MDERSERQQPPHDFGNARRIETGKVDGGAMTEKASVRPQTVGEQLEESIQNAQRNLARLVNLRDNSPHHLLSMPVETLKELAHPGYPF